VLIFKTYYSTDMALRLLNAAALLSFAWLAKAGSPEEPSEAVLATDDVCTGMSEEDCSVSLRQLRLGRTAEALDAESEEALDSDVLQALDIFSQETIETARQADLDSVAVEDLELSSQEDVQSDSPKKECFEEGSFFLQPDGSAKMPGTKRLKVKNASVCQEACANQTGCAQFSFWSDGGCLLTDTLGTKRNHSKVTSGPPSCDGSIIVIPALRPQKHGFWEANSILYPNKVKTTGGLKPPKLASDYNGVAWETMKISGKKEMHIFAIGDWGGLDGNLGKHSMKQYPFCATEGPHAMARFRGPCTTKDMIACFSDKEDCKTSCRYKPEIDRYAQQHVATQLSKRAADKDPDFFLNVGDNFYWGGINTNCGTPMHKIDSITQRQFNHIFEGIYSGPGIDDKPWFSVLGNHDWGGYQFAKAWDQQIAYTWASNRWRMPAFYWMQRVDYPDLDFSAEFFMFDTNMMDAHPLHADPNHNICSGLHNHAGAGCGSTGGPASVDECFKFMWDMWRAEQQWLETSLKNSSADWQVAVTHFNCGHQARYYSKLHQQYGLDLLVTGHTHVQAIHHKMKQLGGMTCFITGGGGGMTSEGDPTIPHTNQYGFFDLTISKDSITIESINFLGEQVGKVSVSPVSVNLTAA